MEKSLNFSEDFLKRRKEEYDVLNQNMRKDSSYQFRGMRYKDIVYGLFQLFSVINFSDINESRNTGLLNVRNRETSEVVGAMYNREYVVSVVDDPILGGKRRDIPCFDIEVIVKSDMVEKAMPLIDAINEYCDGVDIVVEPEIMPEFIVFVWKSGIKNDNSLVHLLVDEFGEESHFVFSTSEVVTHDDQYKLKKVMAVPEEY